MNTYSTDAFSDLAIDDVSDDDFIPAPTESFPRKALLQNFLGGGALAWVAVACAWTVYSNLAGSDPVRHDFATRFAAIKTDVQQSIAVIKRPAKPAAITQLAALFNPAYSLGGAPGTFAPGASIDQGQQFAVASARDVDATGSLPAPQSAARQFAQKLAQSVPLPLSRPAIRPMATPEATIAAADRPTILEKLFGDHERHQAGPQLAYAAPDGGISSVFSNASLPAAVKAVAGDEVTAVYDISARMVYMPDGTKLEAHSGLGDKLDDPNYAHVRMRGVTPPHTYDLTLRESLFHGVQALRLTPVGGEEAIHGRSGLLAHTYMLGPNGDFNGCVSFKNYDAFLRAYQNQKVKRLVVVAKL